LVECFAFVEAFLEKGEVQAEHFSCTNDVFEASYASICTAFVFGAFLGPVGKSGLTAWMTPWDFLFILGFVPIALVIVDLFTKTFSVLLVRMKI